MWALTVKALIILVLMLIGTWVVSIVVTAYCWINKEISELVRLRQAIRIAHARALETNDRNKAQIIADICEDVYYNR